LQIHKGIREIATLSYSKINWFQRCSWDRFAS